MPSDPWQTIAEFYDYVPLYRERKDVEFYVQQARAAEGPVLELGCGSGRVLVPTARAGVAVVGLDASTDMLRLCRRRLEQEGLSAQLFCGDMRRFALRRSFALATIPFRPFQHLLDVEDQMVWAGANRPGTGHVSGLGPHPMKRTEFDKMLNIAVGPSHPADIGGTVARLRYRRTGWRAPGEGLRVLRKLG